MNDIIVYTMENCPLCDQLKEQLSTRNISYRECNLEDPNTVIDLMYKGISVTTAPLIAIRDKIFNTKEIFTQSSLADSLIERLSA